MSGEPLNGAPAVDRSQVPTRRAARSWQLFGSVFAIHALIALAVGEVAWDDGYITLAFARTFAETGHIGLTPFSETVEGATSPLWFLLMAAVYKLGITSFYGFHLASQLLAAACAAGAAVLLYRLILPFAPAAAWWISFLALLMGQFRTETANGMEMTLLCVVVLGIVCLLRDRADQSLWGLAALAAAVPFIRLEAAGYTIAGALGVIVLSRQVRVGAALIASSLAAIAALTYVRYMVFGTVGLTNTMIAKQLSPYSPPFGTQAWNLQLLVSIVIEPVLTLLPAVIVAYVLARMSGVTARSRFREVVRQATARRLPARMGFGIAYGLSYFAFIVVVGSNYFAPAGRMGASAALVLIVVAVMAVPATEGVRRLPSRGYAAVVALFLVPFTGVIAQDTMWIYIARINQDDKLAFNSTTAYRKNGEAMERVRDMLQQPSIKVLLADVGAPSLCCDRVEVLDLGLLANTELSDIGWEEFPDYLRRQSPDLIQTHGVWSQESGIYDIPQFRDGYTPVVVDDSLFYLRNDLFDKVKGGCVPADTAGPYFYAGLEPASSKKGAIDAPTIDRSYLDSLGVQSFCRLA